MTVAPTLSGQDIMDAIDELAGMLPVGLTAADVHGAMLELSASDSIPDLAAGLTQVYDICLSRGLLGGDYLELSVSQAERDAAKSEGNSLEDGSYPIRNVHQLHAAAHLAASGHGDVSAARALIRRRARELGVDIASLPGFGSDGGSMAASGWGTGAEVLRLTSSYPEMFDADPEALILGGQTYTLNDDLPAESGYAGMGGPDAIMARHPALFGGKASKDGRGQHRSGCPDDCAVDHNQPRKGGSAHEHPEVARLIRAHAGLSMFGAAGDDEGNSGNVTHHRAR